ncbi:MAG: ATP-binding protein [Bacteroidales bacterium]|nr:ATP-binding protein [Bacteroidales bacterium]MDP2238437.1 ATP-binding protein [Bacteroidales bacterium]
MLKRIAVTGPESTGKSWLAEKLAAYFHAEWIPEYAREYLDNATASNEHPGLAKPQTNTERNYSLSDIEKIAMMQMELIEKEAKKTKGLLIADTEMLVCSVWAEYVFGEIPESISNLTKNQHFDLYLLCNTDIPWEADALREHPNERAVIFAKYESALIQRGWPYVIISGLHNERLNNAVQAIEKIL